MYKHTCTLCGKEFEDYVKPTYKGGVLKPRFCCREHYLEWHKSSTYVCAYCGKEFKSSHKYENASKARFCSLDHYHKYIKEINPLNYKNAHELNYTCKVCGKKFHLPKSRKEKGSGNFCSISCASSYRMKEKNKKYSEDLNCTCAHCGKKFHKKKSHIGVLNFCNNDCRKAYQKAQRVQKVCQQCGKKFEVTKDKSKTAKFCSVKCHDEYQRRFFIHTTCATCGKPIDVSLTVQHHNKTGIYFCSNKCSNEYFKGENSPMYTGASDVMKILRTYYGLNQRPKIFKRDNKMCRICGKKADHIHHIYPVSKMIKDFQDKHPEIDITKDCCNVAKMIMEEQQIFHDLNNLIAVCEDCHKEIHESVEKREVRKMMRKPYVQNVTDPIIKKIKSLIADGEKVYYVNVHCVGNEFRIGNCSLEAVCAEWRTWYEGRNTTKLTEEQYQKIRPILVEQWKKDGELTKDRGLY